MKKHNKIKKIICILLLVFLLNQIISIITGTNFLSTSIKGILNRASLYTKEIPSIEIKSNEWNSNMGGEWRIDKSAKWTSTSTAEVTLNVDSIIKTTNTYKDVIFILDKSSSMDGNKIDKLKSDAKELVNFLLLNENNKVALVTFDTSSEIIFELTNDYSSIIQKIDDLTVSGVTNYNAALKNVDLILENYKEDNNRELIILFLTDGYPNEDIPNQIATYEILKEKYPFMTINGIQYEMGDQVVNEIKSISDNQYIAYIDNLENVLFEASVNPEPYEKLEIIDYIHDDYFYIESKNDIEVSIGNVNLSEENGLQKITWNIDNYKTGLNETMKVKLKLKEQYVGIDGFYPTNKKEKITSKLTNESEQVINSSLTPVLKSSYNITYDTNPPTGCNIKSEVSEEHFIYEVVNIKNEKLICPGYSFKGWEVVDKVETINDDTFVMPPHDITIRAIWTKQYISKSMDGTIHEKTTLYKVIKDEAQLGTYASKYRGLDSSTYKYDVYYYRGEVTNNNVLFGGFCWKMVRTTDTGGVKMIYNGVPDTNGGCNNTGESSALDSTTEFNKEAESLAYLGYMHNKIYTNNSYYYEEEYRVYYNTNVSSSTNYYFGDTYTWDGQYYTLKNNDNSDIESINWYTNYKNLIGKYYCPTSDINCSSLRYVAGGDSAWIYSMTLNDGKNLADVEDNILIGNSYNKNDDGTFSLVDTNSIPRSIWFNNYLQYNQKYVCSDWISSTCNELYYIISTSNNRFDYITVKEITYGKSFEYDSNTKKYKLLDTISYWNSEENTNNLSNYHYTCLDNSDTCTEIKYIYYIFSSSGTPAYYINISDGKDVNDAINEMLYDNVNVNDSTIKIEIESWFEKNLLNYEKYLEDTIFCNDRSIYELGGWNQDGGKISSMLYFYSSDKRDLTCKNESDRFTKYPENGNGKLKYPVGLLTVTEAVQGAMASNNNKNYLDANIDYWLSSPYYFAYLDSTKIYLFEDYKIDNEDVDRKKAIRPVISLKPGMEYSSGNGTVTNPYIVNLDN